MAADQSRRSLEAARRLQAAGITGQGVASALTWASCQIPAFRAVLFLAAVDDRVGESADLAVASLVALAAEHSGKDDQFPADAAEALVRLSIGQQVELPARDDVSYPAVAMQLLDVILADWVPGSAAARRLLEHSTAENGPAGLSPAQATAWRLVADGELPDREPAQEDIELALANYTSVTKRDPTALWAISGRAELYQMAGRASEALADYDQIVNSVPNPGWAMCRRAEVFRDLGQHEQALAECKRGLQRRPDAQWALEGTVVSTVALKRYEEALAVCDRAIALLPAADWPLSWRAVVHRDTGQYAEALVDVRLALELNPDNDWASANLAGIYAGLGDSKVAHGNVEESLADYERALEADPQHRYAMSRKASALCELERYDDALPFYDQLVALDPGDYLALSGRAQVHFQQDRHEQAIADATRAIAAAPQEELKVADYCTRGVVHQTLGDYELALADFEATIAADPDFWFGWQQRGLMQSYLDQPEAALDSCNHAIELAPAEASARCQRADVYLELGRQDEALADADRAVELELSANTLTTRGNILAQLNNYERAIADLTRALEVDPANGWAAQCRAEALWHLGHLDQALADYHIAVAYTGEDSDAFRGRGLVYQALGRLAEARADFRRAIELDPELAGELGGYLADQAN